MTDLYEDDFDLEDEEDFDSEDLDFNEDDEGGDYVAGLWSRNDFRSGVRGVEDDLVIAHGMVTSFVRVFARAGEEYRVNFDERTKTAGTDLRSRQVLITPAPVLDPNIDARAAGMILTGMACHEVSHVRYGKATAAAVGRAFGTATIAHHLSNILDDFRIERRFAHDYPGYAGIFGPTLKYVADMRPKDQRVVTSNTDPLNLAVFAVRYEQHFSWDAETIREREWWKAWAHRWAPEDSPKRHVVAIREGLEHIAAQKPKPDPLQGYPGIRVPGGGTIGGTQGGGSGGDGSSDQAPSPGDMTDQEVVIEAASVVMRGSGGWVKVDLPTELDDKAVTNAAIKQSDIGQYEVNRLRAQADNAVSNANEREDGVDIARSTRGLLNKKTGHSGLVKRSGLAERYVRDALMAERTSRHEVLRYRKTGRLDAHGLHRLPMGDLRCFEQRRAPSPKTRLVWLLVDVSGSMGYHAAEAASVAIAFAEASQHVRAVRMQVWAWSSSFRPSRYGPGACRVWSEGQPPQKIAELADLRQGGTPDYAVMKWARKAIIRESRRDEHPMIVVMSDGGGDMGVSGMAPEVRAARESGIDVRCVAIGQYLRDSYMQHVYGPGGYVSWQGSIEATARPLAKILAQSIRARHRGGPVMMIESEPEEHDEI